MTTRLKILFATISFLVLSSCQQNGRGDRPKGPLSDTATYKREIAAMLDSFNAAAARADYEKYFSYFAEDAIFMGTDATEHWDKKSFMAWAKPFFDRGHAWNFKSVERHVYFSRHDDIAWFDELLDAPFAKICRGSGVVVRQGERWKVAQYVLSMTIPNSIGDSVKRMKAPIEDSILQKIKG